VREQDTGPACRQFHAGKATRASNEAPFLGISRSTHLVDSPCRLRCASVLAPMERCDARDDTYCTRRGDSSKRGLDRWSQPRENPVTFGLPIAHCDALLAPGPGPPRGRLERTRAYTCSGPVRSSTTLLCVTVAVAVNPVHAGLPNWTEPHDTRSPLV